MTLTQIRLIVMAVVLAVLGGSFWYMNSRIHHFHKLYDNEHVTVMQKDLVIQSMTAAQNDQIRLSGQNVTKVVTVPEKTQSIIKEIRQAPTKPCTLPDYSEEVKNAF